MKNKNIIFWISAVIIVLLLLRACGQGIRVMCNRPKQDTVKIVVDTAYYYEVTDTVYVPKPVVKYQYIDRTRTDTLTEFEVWIEPVDTAAILAEYHSTYIYEEKLPVDYGSMTIKDTVTKNKIKGRSVKLQQDIPVITKTITLTQPKRTIGYIGFSGMGNVKEPLYSIGADFSLKFRSDKIFGIGAQYSRDGNLFYQGRFALPIRLRK